MFEQAQSGIDAILTGRVGEGDGVETERWRE